MPQTDPTATAVIAATTSTTSLRARPNPYAAIGRVLVDNSSSVAARLVSLIGTGSFAYVYLAEDVSAEILHLSAAPAASSAIASDHFDPKPHTPLLKSAAVIQKCAVKRLFKQGLTKQQMKLQRQELAVMKAVSDHPNIVGLLGTFEDDENLFLIMEHCELDLYDAIMQEGGFAEEVVKDMFSQIADAVIHCHERGFSHRDVKPENCLIATGTQQIKLTDFGLATAEVWSTDLGCGSARYMAPECFRPNHISTHPTVPADQVVHPLPSQGYSPRAADVWALGVILLNLLFGRNPWHEAYPSDAMFAAFAGPNPNILREQFRLSAHFDTVLRRVFDLDPRRRCSPAELKRLVADLPFFVEPDSSKVPLAVLKESILSAEPSEEGLAGTRDEPSNESNKLKGRTASTAKSSSRSRPPKAKSVSWRLPDATVHDLPGTSRSHTAPSGATTLESTESPRAHLRPSTRPRPTARGLFSAPTDRPSRAGSSGAARTRDQPADAPRLPAAPRRASVAGADNSASLRPQPGEDPQQAPTDHSRDPRLDAPLPPPPPSSLPAAAGAQAAAATQGPLEQPAIARDSQHAASAAPRFRWRSGSRAPRTAQPPRQPPRQPSPLPVPIPPRAPSDAASSMASLTSAPSSPPSSRVSSPAALPASPTSPLPAPGAAASAAAAWGLPAPLFEDAADAAKTSSPQPPQLMLPPSTSPPPVVVVVGAASPATADTSTASVQPRLLSTPVTALLPPHPLRKSSSLLSVAALRQSWSGLMHRVAIATAAAGASSSTSPTPPTPLPPAAEESDAAQPTVTDGAHPDAGSDASTTDAPDAAGAGHAARLPRPQPTGLALLQAQSADPLELLRSLEVGWEERGQPRPPSALLQLPSRSTPLPSLTVPLRFRPSAFLTQRRATDG